MADELCREFMHKWTWPFMLTFGKHAGRMVKRCIHCNVTRAA